jgi:leucyl aminopeptidase
VSPSARLPRVEVLSAQPTDRALRSADTAVAFGLRQNGQKATVAVRGSGPLARRLGIDLAALAAAEHAGTGVGDVTRVRGTDGGPGQVLLVGVGGGSPNDLRSAAASLARSVRRATLLLTPLATGSAAHVEAVAEGLLLGSYRVAREGLGAAEASPGPRTIQLSGGPDPIAVRRGLTTARATVLARDLANTRSSTKGPAWLARQAEQTAAGSGLTSRVWTGPDLRREGFGALLAVGGGAARGPRLVQLGYRPSARSASQRPHIVLVGKGITFDTGGISLKPREAMLGMTTDMTGSAVVLAVLSACRELGVGVRVTGLMPLAENAIGAASYRPGDVVTTYDGSTVEVRNTDAEGRMVLADAMGYARTRLRPDVLVDVATLTGAATAALGRTHAAVYATDDRLSRALVRAGESTGERLWPMPLVEDYRPLIDSEIADLCQISTRLPVGAGSIMAALFLREFAGDVPWAHLDIPGPARSDRDRAEINRGGTGFGTRLLLRWLQTL